MIVILQKTDNLYIKYVLILYINQTISFAGKKTLQHDILMPLPASGDSQHPAGGNHIDRETGVKIALHA
jgi:hypothetical protein